MFQIKRALNAKTQHLFSYICLNMHTEQVVLIILPFNSHVLISCLYKGLDELLNTDASEMTRVMNKSEH